ncbi:MAG: signal peptide peptidase SppA, partial [Patescibacteria group bacterium]|nr:signal peptide peptidase SppA [Patescibacteria group bacterium]
SPGGEVVASDLVFRKVMEAREIKSVVSWMSGSGASGAYLIAAGSDTIVSHPSSITASIGCILELSNLEGLYEKLGIKHRVFKSGEFKDDEGIYDSDTEGEADQILQDLIDETYEDFISAIVLGRGMEESDVRAVADGRVLSGRSAQECGLVDELGDMDDAISSVEDLVGESDLTVVEYGVSGFWSSLYEYEQVFLNKFNLLPQRASYGVGLYYLLDM